VSGAGAGDGFEVVLLTAPDETVARGLAGALVEARLAACVNLVAGVRSVYRWEGAVEEQAEILLVVKTRAAHAGELERLVRERHPYQVPELLRLPVLGGSAPYLAWLRESCGP
jgi:periplasmic divalent cation tolerance protein